MRDSTDAEIDECGFAASRTGTLSLRAFTFSDLPVSWNRDGIIVDPDSSKMFRTIFYLGDLDRPKETVLGSALSFTNHVNLVLTIL